MFVNYFLSPLITYDLITSIFSIVFFSWSLCHKKFNHSNLWFSEGFFGGATVSDCTVHCFNHLVHLQFIDPLANISNSTYTCSIHCVDTGQFFSQFLSQPTDLFDHSVFLYISIVDIYVRVQFPALIVV